MALHKTKHSLPSPVDFMGCGLHPVTTNECIEVLTAGHEGPFRVTYLNAHCSNLSARDADYRAVVNRCELVYADGQAVVWASRRLGGAVPERVNAGDFILDFCRACVKKKRRIFLLGGAEGLAEEAARAWSKGAPGLQIAGVYHGYFKREEEEALCEMIRKASPDIILLGMSAPRQELWMDRWSERLDVPVLWCVGALFEYYSGVRARAPRWMRRAGLEWLFRLCLEPRRLWRRYLVGNVKFVWRVLRSKSH